jgi:hypothetical protein
MPWKCIIVKNKNKLSERHLGSTSNDLWWGRAHKYKKPYNFPGIPCPVKQGWGFLSHWSISQPREKQQVWGTLARFQSVRLIPCVAAGVCFSLPFTQHDLHTHRGSLSQWQSSRDVGGTKNPSKWEVFCSVRTREVICVLDPRTAIFFLLCCEQIEFWWHEGWRTTWPLSLLLWRISAAKTATPLLRKHPLYRCRVTKDTSGFSYTGSPD